MSPLERHGLAGWTDLHRSNLLVQEISVGLGEGKQAVRVERATVEKIVNELMLNGQDSEAKRLQKALDRALQEDQQFPKH